jgi:hypothetical protein
MMDRGNDKPELADPNVPSSSRSVVASPAANPGLAVDQGAFLTESISPGVLKRMYMSYRGTAQIRETRHGLWLALVVYLLFGIADAMLIPDVATAQSPPAFRSRSCRSLRWK